MDAAFYKTSIGIMAADRQTEDWINKFKIGEGLHGKFTKMRNPAFHRKYFAMLNTAYEYWEPGEIDCKWGKPEKNFDRFREDLQILAGYGEIHHRVDGSFRVVSKSISFGSMEEPEFNKLYNSVLTVILERIMVGMSEDEFNKILEFA